MVRGLRHRSYSGVDSRAIRWTSAHDGRELISAHHLPIWSQNKSEAYEERCTERGWEICLQV
jgi:hypothetical protein